MKELYESKRQTLEELYANQYIPHYEEAFTAVRQAQMESKAGLDDFILCMKAEENLKKEDVYLPMELFEIITKDIRAL